MRGLPRLHLPPPGRASLRRRIAAVGAVLVVAFAASSVYDVWRSYRQSLDATNQELTTLSRALAEQAARGFQSVDLVMRDTASWYAASGDRVHADFARQRLEEHTSGLPVLGIAVGDAQGVPRYSWFSSRLPLQDVADPTRFIPRRDAGAALDISASLASAMDERTYFVLSRGAERYGRFSGTVNALIDLDDFQQFYRAIGAGAGDRILLLRDDGLLLASQPPSAEAMGKNFRPLAVRRALAAEPAGLIVSSHDKVPRFIAASAVRGYPFVVAVTRDESAALAAWSEQTVHVAVRTLALSLIGALLIAALLRQLARVEAAEAGNARLEAQLRQSQKMEAMGTFAGGIAHDFNNILGAILGYGELAQKNLPEGGVVRRYLDHVVQAGARGKGLVERILAFSRSGLGERTQVHMHSAVEETLELLAASLPAHVRLETRLDAGDAAVSGDPTQLHQVVMNLCTNAVEAMERRGILRVVLDRVTLAERRSLSHGPLPPGVYVRLAITDTGSGIPSAVLERMFDPFFTTKGVGRGTGLGLSLVHGTVSDLGGAIDVATRAGAGSTFTVWLPAAGETAKPGPDSGREVPRGRGETVMVVDDERSLVALAEETLAELGYEPAGFDSSVAALEAFHAEPQRFDLVLTDETMPDLTGVELAREIRRARPDLPIVLMSGYSGAQLTERAQATGVAEVLRKPLVRRDIAEALSRALRSTP
jgi:signal transduction histidine kinase/ActR/RegA family two-component response regulator